MSDPVQLAKTARQHLIQALGHLQSDAAAGQDLDAIAEPIARGMGLLHRIEKSGGTVLEGRDDVLAIVRNVLDRLQKLPTGGLVDDVTDAVASSLSKVHALVKYQPAAAAPPAPPAAQAHPAPEAAAAPPASNRPKKGPSSPPIAATPGANTQLVEVELGTHSPSNFYKGLSGNDVIDHGGVFVATYKVPKPGTPLLLSIHMPGNFEFQASGVVQWTREGSDGVEPGFGAKLTSITQEARQLVYRYTRNREPIFYDDL